MREGSAVTTPRVSFAIPLYNEEAVLPELYRRTSAVLSELPGEGHEMVIVDDGSRDGTLEIVAELALADPRVKVVSLSRNFGHQAALSAALDHVSGDVVVVMDGDLQDTPETAFRFLEKFHEGYEVVYAVRINRKEGCLLKCCYALFYRLIASLSDIRLPMGAGDFALLSRRVVEHMKRSPERHRYLRGLRTWVGFRQTGLEVERAARKAGRSKYNLRNLLRLACDGIFSFSTLPLRAATLLGAATIAGSLIYAGYATISRLFFAQVPPGFTALIVSITFIAGVQMLFLGVIGEYVGRIYQEVKQRPLYVIDRVLTSETMRDLDRPLAVAGSHESDPQATNLLRAHTESHG